MKLYKITTGLKKFRPAYVLADNPELAETAVKNWLNHNNYGSPDDRVVTRIEPIAENYIYSKYEGVLLGEGIVMPNILGK